MKKTVSIWEKVGNPNPTPKKMRRFGKKSEEIIKSIVKTD